MGIEIGFVHVCTDPNVFLSKRRKTMSHLPTSLVSGHVVWSVRLSPLKRPRGSAPSFGLTTYWLVVCSECSRPDSRHAIAIAATQVQSFSRVSQNHHTLATSWALFIAQLFQIRRVHHRMCDGLLGSIHMRDS